jgi:molybdopterin molybdotransferase
MIGRKIMSGFPSLINADKALNIILEYASKIKINSVKIDIENSLGRILAEDIYANIDLPPFDRSTVDGYAVIAEDTFGSSPINPTILKIVNEIECGINLNNIKPLNSGECSVIFTGAPLPPNANAVVMVENAKRKNGLVEIYKQVQPFSNVSRKGEDFKKGEIVAKKGTRIKAWHIGAITSFNIKEISVYRKIKVALISTGSELREVGSIIKPGEIINTTKPLLKALLKEKDCEIIDLGSVPDNMDKIKEKIIIGLNSSDILIITGGSSLGKKDIVPEAINDIAKPGLIFHGVAIRPGKTMGFGVNGDKLIFMISGLPVAAMISFIAFIEPAIDKILNCFPEPKPIIKARLSRRVANPVGFKSFMRVFVKRINNSYIAEPLRLTGSGILSTLTKANGILIIPENIEGYEENEEIEVLLTQPLGDDKNG